MTATTTSTGPAPADLPGRRPEDEYLGFGRTVGYGLQHILAMFGGVIVDRVEASQTEPWLFTAADEFPAPFDDLATVEVEVARGRPQRRDPLHHQRGGCGHWTLPSPASRW